MRFSNKPHILLLASHEYVQNLMEIETSCYGSFGDLSIASVLLKHKTIKFTRVKKMTLTFLNIPGHDCEIQTPLSLQSELSLYKFS